LLTAKPLLSMRTVGSNDVERRVKPLKLTMLTKKRNRLQDPKGICLFCASENLRYIMTAKNILGNWKERYWIPQLMDYFVSWSYFKISLIYLVVCFSSSEVPVYCPLLSRSLTYT
jgi:hypothetical protein